MWRRYADGNLAHAPSQVLLDDAQQEWVRQFWASELPGVWLIGRQRGKSHSALMLALEFGLRTERAVTRYCALTKDSAIGIVEPILTTLLADCPANIRPRVVTTPEDEDAGVIQRRRLWFPSSSAELVIFGTDAQSFRKGRGPRTDLQLFDECGFYQDLLGVESALRPALQTTRGRSLYLSSPPESPAHPFVDRVRAARGTGRLIHDTFRGNPRIDHEAIIREEAALRGQTRAEFLASTYFRREYMAEVVTEESRAAVPSWPAVAAECTREQARPLHFDGYTAHDWGGYEGAPHAALFGYVAPGAARLVIEDADEVRGAPLGQLADRWKGKEVSLWGERAWDGTLWGAGYFERHARQIPDYLRAAVVATGPSQPFIRVCDHDEQLQGEMVRLYGYAMLPTAKHEKHLLIDDLNNGIREKRVVIHPRCRRLLEQLATTLWDLHRRQWVRTEKDHGDLLDCLLYMWRNAFWAHDPSLAPPPDYWGRPAADELADLARAMTGGARRRC